MIDPDEEGPATAIGGEDKPTAEEESKRSEGFEETEPSSVANMSADLLALPGMKEAN